MPEWGINIIEEQDGIEIDRSVLEICGGAFRTIDKELAERMAEVMRKWLEEYNSPSDPVTVSVEVAEWHD